MTVRAYNIVTDPDHMRQTLGAYTDYSGTANDSVSVDTPEILVHGNLLTENYVYIDTFNRYYNVKNRVVVRDGLTLLVLESDPLMSFAAYIEQCPAYVFRSSYNYNMDMVDRDTPTVIYDRVTVIGSNFGNVVEFGTSDTDIYLQCIGGKGW